MGVHASGPKLKPQCKLQIIIKLEGKQEPRCVLMIEVCHRPILQKRLREDEGLQKKGVDKIM